MPSTPTNLQPINGSTVTTSNFGVACALQVNPLRQQAQWQVSTSSGFGTVLRTITTDLRNPGSLSMRVGTPRIAQGTFFVRCRAIDEIGGASAWSAPNSFTIFHPATGLARIPANGASVPWTNGDTNFTWDFFDTSDLDTQSAYRITVIVSPDDATYTNVSLLYNSYTALVGAFATYQLLKAPPSITNLYDTGKLVDALTTTRTVTLPLPAAAHNRAVRWQVQTWDNDDQSAGPSTPTMMFAGDLPIVTVTAPIGTTSVSSPVISWSYTSPSGSPQQSYQVVVRDANTSEVIYASNIINTATKNHTPTVPVFQNQRTAVISVTVTSANGMQVVASTVITPQWVTPPGPSFDLDRSLYDTAGFVDITWPDAFASPTFITWKVYRRDSLTSPWVTLGITQEKVWRDYTAPPKPAAEYAVTQVATIQGEATESSLIPQSIDLTSSIYLLTVDGEGVALRLHNVTADDFTKEYEESIMNIVGVGRKAEVGSTWGMKGTLTLQLRDSVGQGMASEHWALLEEIKEQRKMCVLRIPFGRIIQCHIGDLNASRIAGVTSEIMDVTFDYTEVR